MHKIIALTLFVLIPFFTFSQEEEFIFFKKYYDASDGLIGREVASIIQDQKGMIWILTNEGINYFDGYSFNNISLPEKRYKELQIDANGMIWLIPLSSRLPEKLIMSFYDYIPIPSIIIIDPISKQKIDVIKYLGNEFEAKDKIYIHKYKEAIWIQNKNDFYRFGESLKKINLPNLEKFEDFILLATERDFYWLIDQDHQVAKVSKNKIGAFGNLNTLSQDKQLIQYFVDQEGDLLVKEKLLKKSILHISKLNNIGKWQLIYESDKASSIESNENIEKIPTDFHRLIDSIFLCSSFGRIDIINDKSDKIKEYLEEELDSRHGFFCIYLDTNNLIWFCTYQGVYSIKISRNPFSNIFDVNGEAISSRALAVTKKGSVFANTY